MNPFSTKRFYVDWMHKYIFKFVVTKSTWISFKLFLFDYIMSDNLNTTVVETVCFIPFQSFNVILYRYFAYFDGSSVVLIKRTSRTFNVRANEMVLLSLYSKIGTRIIYQLKVYCGFIFQEFCNLLWRL